MDFTYYLPTKVIMGKHCITKNKEIFSSLGKNVLIVTGSHSAKVSGALTDICNVLAKNQINYSIFDEVKANPTFEIVKKGAMFAAQNEVDYIIGIGGGSPLDAAKAIAILVKNNLDADLFFNGEYAERILPVVAIPLTSGTGSEVTQYSIIIDEKTNRKRGIRNEQIFPKYAFLDVRYLKSLDNKHFESSVLDALSHAIEGYLAKRSTLPSDLLAEECFKIFGLILPELSNEKASSEMKELLFYASMIAGQVISLAGTTVVHAMGYYLTTFNNIDHGRANALLLSEFLNYSKSSQIEKVNRIYALMYLPNHFAFEKIINQLLKEKETLTEEEINKFSELVMQETHIQNTEPEADLEIVKEIYKKSMW